MDAFASGSAPGFGDGAGARTVAFDSTLFRNGVNPFGTSDASALNGMSSTWYIVLFHTVRIAFLGFAIFTAEAIAASTRLSSWCTSSCVRTTFVPPSSKYLGMTSSGFPTATSRSLPTSRSDRLRSSTDSSKNRARRPPVLGVPHALAANVRGSKQNTGRTSTSPLPLATSALAASTTRLSRRRRSVPRNHRSTRADAASSAGISLDDDDAAASADEEDDDARQTKTAAARRRVDEPPPVV
mmetsp:Transcript_10181/g.36876  ORF Transcript_10181/g.36876 Transcript_10181/m.36876 type:complete len:241 (-) Transcript_10181:280-1002(-)